MYYMAISIFLILFGLLWTIAGMTVCKKLYDKVRNEDHQERGKVIQRIMKTYAMAQLLSWPISSAGIPIFFSFLSEATPRPFRRCLDLYVHAAGQSNTRWTQEWNTRYTLWPKHNRGCYWISNLLFFQRPSTEFSYLRDVDLRQNFCSY